MGQACFGLLHSQLVVLLLELSDYLSFANYAAEIYGNRLQPAGDLHSHGGLVIGGEIAVDGDALPNRHFLHFCSFNLSWLTLGIRTRSLAGRRIIALAGNSAGRKSKEDNKLPEPG